VKWIARVSRRYAPLSHSSSAAVVPRLADARAVFERLDPGARFANAHLARLGLR